MEVNKIDLYLMSNQKYFPSEKIIYLKERLTAADEDKLSLLSAVELKDPTTMLLVSVFLGELGIDRFLLGDTGMGILKLLTAGCCGILYVMDWFTITNKTKESNYSRVISIL